MLPTPTAQGQSKLSTPTTRFQALCGPMGTYCNPPKLHDLTAGRDTLYTASSRLEHGIIGVLFAKCQLPFSAHDPPRRLCEYRSEQGNTCDDVAKHATYIASASSTKNIGVRGHRLVDGHGNFHSYCTHIQENLRAAHYNCTYSLLDGLIWITQTAPIAANEELSIQYSKEGSF
jgi:hypothetical protein